MKCDLCSVDVDFPDENPDHIEPGQHEQYTLMETKA
jgi:hypothetical protein